MFVPSRNALFARLNLLLPERAKRALLFGLFPEKREAQGFPSYYDQCTPRRIQELGVAHGLELVKAEYYFKSSYFSFFLPFYVLWRGWVVASRALFGCNAAETFSYAMVKRSLAANEAPNRSSASR